MMRVHIINESKNTGSCSRLFLAFNLIYASRYSFIYEYSYDLKRKKTKHIFLIFTDNVSAAGYNYNTSCGYIRYVL